MPKPVGCPPWTTSEQYAYLEKFLPDMDDKKVGNGLTQVYTCITRDFSLLWEPPIVEKDRKIAESEEHLKKLSYKCRACVSPPFSSSKMPPLTLTVTANF